jgi:DNA polymerase
MRETQPRHLKRLKKSCSSRIRTGPTELRPQLVVGRGNPQAELLLIGEAPGADEDARGVPFVGRSGQLLSDLMIEAGLDEEHDLYICNVIKCRPPKNRKPTSREIELCRPWLEQQIALINPALVLLAGSTALEAVLGIRSGISKLRGQWYPHRGRDVMPVFHPSYLLRFRSREVGTPQDLTLKDLREARRRLQLLSSS